MDAGKFIVTAHRRPYNFNDPQSYIVEAESEAAAIQLIQVELRDLAVSANYGYTVRKYDLPEVQGKIIGRCR
jgi:hypothetical protein